MRMTISRLATITAISALLAGTAAAQASGISINPGLWQYSTEMSMQMNMNGQAMDIPSQTETVEECVTPEEAVFSPDDLAREGCVVSNLQQSGNAMSFTMACDSDGMTMTGDVSMNTSAGGDSSEAVIVLSGEQPGMGTISINAKMSGQRIGACEG